MKSLEYRIWRRSFRKGHKYLATERNRYLENIQKLIRNIRSIRLDKNVELSHNAAIKTFDKK